jgi:hypothetical protein
LKEKLIWGLAISNPALSSKGELIVHINEKAKKVVSAFYVNDDKKLIAVEQETKFLVPIENVELKKGNVIVTY